MSYGEDEQSVPAPACRNGVSDDWPDGREGGVGYLFFRRVRAFVTGFCLWALSFGRRNGTLSRGWERRCLISWWS